MENINFEYEVELTLLSIELKREARLRESLEGNHAEKRASKARSSSIIIAANAASMAMAAGNDPRTIQRYSFGGIVKPEDITWVKRDTVDKGAK